MDDGHSAQRNTESQMSSSLMMALLFSAYFSLTSSSNSVCSLSNAEMLLAITKLTSPWIYLHLLMAVLKSMSSCRFSSIHEGKSSPSLTSGLSSAGIKLDLLASLAKHAMTAGTRRGNPFGPFTSMASSPMAGSKF